jgi:catechol 2,3-dioxygenase
MADRLPAATRVGIVRLQVADLARSLTYYGELLGFTTLERREGSAVLGAADRQPLLELRERPGARRVPPSGVLGLYHFAILLPDRPSLGRFVTHLAGRNTRLASADHLVSEAIYLWDPDGLGVEVYADRPRSEWRSRNGEIVMVTDPLDLESLVDAGGGEAWAGLPAATIIGHVHLQVGDLDEARRFYEGEIGFDVTVWSYPGALFLSAGGYHHHLGTNVWAASRRPASDDDARLLEWELLVPGAAAQRTVADPWGTSLRLSPLE